jgi:hypothetical protein
MATNMRTAHTTRSIEDYLNDFAGREGMFGYDPEKPIHIAEENRDFVWSMEMCKALIVSIFGCYSIPLMVICDDFVMDGGNRSTALMKWRNNEFTVKFGEWEGTYSEMPSPLAARWNRCMIPMTIITHATPEERSQIYENYNKGIVLTTGHLLWNRKYLPLVQMATALIGWGGGEFPFADVIHQVWRSTWKKTKTLSDLAFAYSILAGSMFGKDFFHTKFSLHVTTMLNTRADQIDLSNLQFICTTLQSIDPEQRVNPKIKEQVFKKFIGAMIFDIHTLSRGEFQEKWVAFCTKAYTVMTKDEMKRVIDVGTARATNDSRIQRLSNNVSAYLADTMETASISTETDDEEEEEGDE